MLVTLISYRVVIWGPLLLVQIYPITKGQTLFFSESMVDGAPPYQSTQILRKKPTVSSARSDQLLARFFLRLRLWERPL